MSEARKRKCYDFKFKNCGLYLRVACINYFSSYLRLVFEGGFYSRKYGNVFEKPYQPDQAYRFPKRLFGKRLKPSQSAWFTLYSWFYYQPESDAVICYICAKHNRNGNLDSITNKEPAFISTGFCNWKKAIECFDVHRISKCHKTSLTFEKTIPKCKNVGVMFNSDTERKRETERKYFRKVMETVQELGRQGIPFQGD